MVKSLRTCRCGNTYHAQDSLECPVCGRIGKPHQTIFHRCSACAMIEGCPPERKEATAKAGVCMHYKCPELVRYEKR